MYKPGIRYLIKFCLSYLVSETLNGTLTTQLKSWGGVFTCLFCCLSVFVWSAPHVYLNAF